MRVPLFENILTACLLRSIFCGFSTTLSPPLAARQLQLGENHNGMVFKPYNKT
jgi:hypothetical protein